MLTGFILLGLWRTGRGSVIEELVLRAALSVGLGLGIFSCLFFLLALPLGLSRGRLQLLELALLLCVSGVVASVRRKLPSMSDLRPATEKDIKLRWVLFTGFALSLLSSLATFFFLSSRLPSGRWDGWVLWNMRARFLFKGGEHWTDAFSSIFTRLDHQPDYPLLLPLSVARGWEYVGRDTVLIPITIALLFTFAVATLLYSSLSVLRSKGQGLLAGLILLGTPYFILRGAAQEADVPLSFFFLATVVLLLLYGRAADKNSVLLILAGLMAGFAAWTKNEGWLFLVAVVAARSIVMIVGKNWKAHLRQMLFFMLGLAPVLITVLYFKVAYAPQNNLLAGQGMEPTLHRLVDPSRYLVVFRAAIKYIYSFGAWEIHPLTILAIYPLCLGLKIEEEDRPGVFTIIITLALMLLGEFMIYVISPYDLNWHMGTSFSRLILQLWPTLLLLYFLIIRSPEESLHWKEA